MEKGDRDTRSLGAYRLVAEPTRTSAPSGDSGNQIPALEKRLGRLTIWLIVLSVVNVSLVTGGFLVWHHYAPIAAAASTKETTRDPTSSSRIAPITAAEYSWWLTTGQRIVNSIQADVRTIVTAVPAVEDNPSLEGYATVVTDCEGLESGAKNALAATPAPNGTLETSWSTALKDYIQGGQACVEGVNTRSQALTSEAVSEVLVAGQQDYALAVDMGRYAAGR